jgi:pilus assembly protein Flp/PilA
MRGANDGSGLRRLCRDQSGASAVEYGLILSLIFLALMGAVATLGDSVEDRWDDIASRVAGA